MARVTPLAADANPDLQESFGHYAKLLGYVPNSVLIMQHKPKMVKALALLAQSVWDPASKVPLGFKRLVACIWPAASMAAITAWRMPRKLRTVPALMMPSSMR